MVTKNNINQKSYIYFHYSSDVKNELKQAVKDACLELKDKTKKNKAFFADIHMNICHSHDDLKGLSPFSIMFKKSKDENYTAGATITPLYKDQIKEIIIKTEDADTGILGFFRKDYSYNTIYEATLHELGHEFSHSFGEPLPPPDENMIALMKKYAKEPPKGAPELLSARTVLSGTEEFKEAWRKDVNKMKNMPDEEYEKLNYISPNLYSGIDVSDGVNDEELEQAAPDREEAFAQLFAYALSGNKNVEWLDKQTILKSYSNAFEVVKSYITKFLGIKL